MCILFVYANPSPQPGGYKLIVASNRDEFYARPARPAFQWPQSEAATTDTANDPNSADFIIGGQDMEPGREGGTWLAVGQHGGQVRLAALLNITGERHSEAEALLGRGFLCGNYVAGELVARDYCERLVTDAEAAYNAFNLVTVEMGAQSAEIRHCSNAPATNQPWTPTKDSPQAPSLLAAYGNSPPTTPLAKVCAGRLHFDAICRATTTGCVDRDQLHADLLRLLQDPTRYWPDAELARRSPQWGHALSSIMVRVPGDTYGTRTHSVILIDADNRLDYYERTMDAEGPQADWLKSHITRTVRMSNDA